MPARRRSAEIFLIDGSSITRIKTAAGWILAAIALALYLRGVLPLLGSTTFDDAYMSELAVHEPHAMSALRVRPGRVEERELEIFQRLRPLDARGVGHIQHPQPGRLFSFCVGLVRNDQHVSREAEGVAARGARSCRRELDKHRRALGVRDVDYAEAGARAFVREIQEATAIGPLLDGESLAAVAVTVEI